MSQDRRVWGRRAILAAGVLGLASLGCNPATMGYFLFRGDEKVPPEHPLPPKEGKDGITVAILTSSAPTLSMEFAAVDRELAQKIAKRLVEETKDADHPITVIEQSKVDRLKSSGTRDWRTMNGADIGKELGADYVIDMTVTSMSMLQPEYGKEYYQGRASLQVVVYDSTNRDGPYREYVHNSMLPTKSTEAVTPAFYRNIFLDRVATELAWRHIPHVADRQMVPVR